MGITREESSKAVLLVRADRSRARTVSILSYKITSLQILFNQIRNLFSNLIYSIW